MNAPTTVVAPPRTPGTVPDAVPFTVPALADAARDAAQRVLRSGWLTTGPRCAEFEAALSAYLGQPYVVTVASCTQALELSLHALHLDPGAPVLTPSLTFCGAVGAIAHAGYRPVLVDIDEATLTPSPRNVADAVARLGRTAGAGRHAAGHSGSRPAAMVVCDLGGYPVDWAALADAAGLPYDRIVVDAAHGPGGAVGRAEAGRSPYATCLSFYATKNLPVGEGGAVATYDESLAGWLRAARLHGMSKDAWRRYLPGGSWRYDVPEVGYKANLTDLAAAIGCAQLAALPGWQDRRRELVARYDAVLAAAPLADVVRLPARHPDHAWHLYQVRVPRRDEVAARLAEHGVATSVHFIPVHQLSGYARLLGADELAAVPVTDRVADELLSLPLYPGLADEAVDRVSGLLANLLA
ncbi:MAG TPA: DegT/DnrJ/EryC1/StrS aminotransferase family protein [Pilimelia sp.]|nr:DegT/DnrJ/EryC1/StrS aminotransferase family protein [Pilimelia sp.]